MPDTIAKLTEYEVDVVKITVGSLVIDVNKTGFGSMTVDGKQVKVKSITVDIVAGHPPTVFAELVP